MSITEIILIIAGVIVLALGYLLPARKRDGEEEVQLIGEDEVRKLVSKEVEGTKEHILDIVDETVTYAMEKTERSMERVANEKIMAINEYSDTVLDDINKNHKEVLFLYDMLNDKHENLKTTVSEVSRAAEEIKQTVKDVEITVKEAELTVKEAEITTKEGEFPIKETIEEKSDFIPINPPTVTIIHGPESDYVAEDVSEEIYEEEQELFSREYDVSAEQEFAPRVRKKKSGAGRTFSRTFQESGEFTELEAEDAPAVDLRFTGGKEGNRNSNERILELHKAGKSNMAIAKELGLGIGEVKLVIDLFEGL